MEAAASDQPSKTAAGSLAGPRQTRRRSASARLARSDSWLAWTHGLQRGHLSPLVGASCADHWEWKPLEEEGPRQEWRSARGGLQEG